MAIRKEDRGRGLGTAILEQTLQKCRGKFEIIELSVFSNNDDAKRLYEVPLQAYRCQTSRDKVGWQLLRSRHNDSRAMIL